MKSLSEVDGRSAGLLRVITLVVFLLVLIFVYLFIFSVDFSLPDAFLNKTILKN